MVNSLLIVVMCLAAFVLAYIFYSRFLARKVLKLDPKRTAPSHQYKDGRDYVPSNRFVLFGHHFSTIAGLGPIVGPANRNAVRKALENRFVASALAVAAIAYFALLRIEGQPVGMILWVLFGTTNQLLAGLGLLLATVYLHRKGRPIVYTLVPMIIVFAFTLTAVVIKLYQFFNEGSWSVFWVGLAVLVLAVWLAVESILSIKREKKAP